MTWLIVFVVAVLIMQVVLFFVIRAKKKAEKANSIIDKYNIRSTGDAFKLMNDTSIPEEDRKRIEEVYNGSDDN
ncbi:MAG: hypothetical protein AAFN93_15480 [Bacteroidota bacterium]